ncbi:MAG: hypothetical protein NUV64_01560 [Parcubacteria group bacterium]|nr:hypothetical protein [Parcubacteria group bacterium]MCR4342730.1 hypothetical protein [Patescibacteria group bacterium]
MRDFIFKFLITLIFIVFLGLPNTSESAGADFSVTLIPQNPTPGSTVTAKLKSLHFDVDRASITWSVDGKVLSKGIGKDVINFSAPAFGKKSTVSASVTTVEGDFGSDSVVLVGNDLDLLWEAITTTPFSYKGRSLPSLQSQVKVTAIPYLFKNGSMLKSSDLIYEWSLNFKKDKSASGAGKDYFIFQTKDQDDYTISLKVSSRTNDIVFEKGIILPLGSMKPRILLYKDHPLEGPRYEEALKGSVEVDSEISLRAEPFFFSRNNISFDWKMNRNSILPDEAPNILKLKVPEGERGESSIALNVKNNFNVLQFANTALKIIFGNN